MKLFTENSNLGGSQYFYYSFIISSRISTASLTILGQTEMNKLFSFAARTPSGVLMSQPSSSRQNSPADSLNNTGLMAKDRLLNNGKLQR
jgi:hypothetical protein